MKHAIVIRTLKLMVFILLYGATLSGSSLWAFDEKHPEGFAFVREKSGIYEYKLESNSLSVLLYPDSSHPVATFMIVYHAAARHEKPGKSGAAHFLEHMMYKGTEQFNWEKGTAIPSLFDYLGSVHNALTGLDSTRYFATVPSHQLEAIVRIEADRVRHALIEEEEFEREKKVVLNEIHFHNDSPFVQVYAAAWKTAFEHHPYRYVVMGDTSEIEAMEYTDLFEFYDSHYWPGQATVIVTGDFEIPRILMHLQAYFGPVEASEDPLPPVDHEEPAQIKSRRVDVFRPDPLNAVLVNFKSPPVSHEDHLKLEILTQILAAGRKSRLYQDLVHRQYAVHVLSDISDTVDPGLLTIGAILGSDGKHKKVEKTILKLLKKIQKTGVTETEFQRAVAQLKNNFVFSWDGSYAVAEALEAAVTAGDWQLYPTFPKRLDTVTAEDIQKVAAKYLVPNQMTTAYLISDPEIQEPAAELPPGTTHFHERRPSSPVPQWTNLPPAIPYPSFHYQEKIQSTQLPKTTVLSLKTNLADAVYLQGSFYGAGSFFAAENSVLADVTAGMLGRKTTHHDKFELAELLEDRGIQLSFSADLFRIHFDARMKKEDLEVTVEVLSDILQRSLFEDQDLREVKQETAVDIQQRMSDTAGQSFSAFKRNVFPLSHPHYEAPFVKQFEDLMGLSVEDISLYYKNTFGPNQFYVVATGDIDHGRVVSLINHSFKDWAPVSEPPGWSFGDLELTKGRQEIPVPGKANADVVMGHVLNLDRLHPDYPALYMGSYLLGGDFSSHLARSVRDRQGLSYSINSFLTGFERNLNGYWLVAFTANRDLLKDALSQAKSEIHDFIQTGITPAELEKRKQSIQGRFLVGMGNSDVLAQRVLYDEELGLGTAYLDQYPQNIERLTAPEVERAVKTHLNDSMLYTVAAGEFEEEAFA